MPARLSAHPARREPRRPRPLLLRSVLGDVLRRARLGQRRTLADVAEVARVSVPYLSEVERGRKEASSEVLAAICEALRMPLSDVLAEVGRDLDADRARTARVVPLAPVAPVAPVGPAAPARPAVAPPAQAARPDVVCLAA
jgi:transcriptional regulator with XRE-family HTH domain